MKIPGLERKNTGKFLMLVKVLMKFQGKKGKKKQWRVVKVLMEFKRGTVSENGYPQEGYVLFLEKFFIEINLILSKSVFIVLSRKNYNKVLRRKG